MSGAGSPGRVAVLGAGSWGTALASLACQHADTLLWARDPATVEDVNQHHRNTRYLGGIPLPAALRATADFDAAVRHALAGGPGGLVILGAPVAALGEVCAALAAAVEQQASARDTLHVIWTCKGFHHDSGLLPHEIAGQVLGACPQVRLGVLSGPSFAGEVARGLPVALTLAAGDPATCAAGVAALHGRSARLYSSADVVGVEVGGAMKNIIAIACGVADGLALGENARAALITRGLAEMQRLGVALGGQASTFSGLAGLGDLVLTATSTQSRNQRVGLAIGHGQRLDDILAGGMTAEGVRCARAAQRLGRRHGVALPITDAVCQVLFDALDPRTAVSQLLSRVAGPET